MLGTQGSPEVPDGHSASVPHAPRSMSIATSAIAETIQEVPRRVRVRITAGRRTAYRGSDPGVRAL